jgi:cobalt transporter subunit CbtA
MAVFRSIVFAAVLSGLLVGSFATIAQHIATVPLIVQAEVYEQQAHNEQHEDEGWQPANGFERNTYTALFNLVDWIGFALLLNGALVLMRRPVTWRDGYLCGLGAFVALPPELPGVPTAPLLPRQLWWTATVMATACGLGLIAFSRSAVVAAAAILLIAAPPLWGRRGSSMWIPTDRARGAADVSLDTAPHRRPCQALRAGLADATGRRTALSAALGAHRTYARSAEGGMLSQRWADYCSAHDNHRRVGPHAEKARHINAKADPQHRRTRPSRRSSIDTGLESVSCKPLIYQPKSMRLPSHREHESGAQEFSLCRFGYRR